MIVGFDRKILICVSFFFKKKDHLSWICWMKCPRLDFVSPLVKSSAFLKAMPVLQVLSLKLR